MIEVLPIEGGRLKDLFNKYELSYDEKRCFGYSAQESNENTGIILVRADEERYMCTIVRIEMQDKSDLWLLDGFTRACATQAMDKRFIRIVYDESTDDDYAKSMLKLGYRIDGDRLVMNIADLTHTCEGCSKNR